VKIKMHNTRSEMPREWPLARKGNKYYIVANHGSKKNNLVIVLETY
jgi:ribosomal protein S4E